MPAVSEEEIQEGITRNIIPEIEQDILNSRMDRSRLVEDKGVQADMYTQTDIVSRTFKQSRPYFKVGERESTNVVDERGVGRIPLFSPQWPMDNKPPFRTGNSWSDLIQDSDGLVEDVDDILQEYNNPMSRVHKQGAAEVDAPRVPPWVKPNGEIDLKSLKEDMKGYDRDWVGNPATLDNGGTFSYPAPRTWKQLEQETGMSKGDLRKYLYEKARERAKDAKDYRYLSRSIEDIFSQDTITGYGIGEGWADIQSILRPEPQDDIKDQGIKEVPKPSTGDDGDGEGKAYYGS